MTWFISILAGLIVIILIILFLNQFYVKATKEFAKIRTGAGGKKIVIDGGCLSLPFLHETVEVNMSTMRLEVERTGVKSVITTDRLRLDVEVEFYLRVNPTPNGVEMAAQALGSSVSRQENLQNLLEGKLVDAIQSVAAARTMDELHEKRQEFSAEVKNHLTETLANNGLQLESVSLTRLDQTPFSALDENNAFNAVGIRRLTEIISSNKKQRTQIEAETDISMRQAELEREKRKLLIDQELEETKFNKNLNIERIRSDTQRDIHLLQQHNELQNEKTVIDKAEQLKIVEIERDRSLRKNEIDALLEVEYAKIESSISLAKKRNEEVAVQATIEEAKIELILAEEKTQLEKERAAAQRNSEITLLKTTSDNEVNQTKTEGDNQVSLDKAKTEASIKKVMGDAEKEKMQAEAEGRKALAAAENDLSGDVIKMKLDMHRVENMPQILEQVMKPVEKIESIRINQITGFDHGSGNGGKDTPPVNQALDSILTMALQLPAMQKLGKALGTNLEVGLEETQAEHITEDSKNEAKPASEDDS